MPSCAKPCRLRKFSEKYGVSADVWSVTSYKALYMDGIEDRALEPAASRPKSRAFLMSSKCLAERAGSARRGQRLLEGASQHDRQPWMPRRLSTLGTDGFGRSESRESLRDFFEVDARFIALAALQELLREKKIQASVVQKAIKDLKINTEKRDPVTT